MSRLSNRVTEASLSRGVLHTMRIRELRLFMSNLSDEDFVAELKDVKEPRHLRTLWEAGLSAFRQAKVEEKF